MSRPTPSPRRLAAAAAGLAAVLCGCSAGGDNPTPSGPVRASGSTVATSTVAAPACAPVVAPGAEKIAVYRAQPSSYKWIYYGTIENRCSDDWVIRSVEPAQPASSEDMTLLGGWQVAPVKGTMGPDAYSPATKAAATQGQVVGQRLVAGSTTSLRAGVQLPANITIEGRALPIKVVARSAEREVTLLVRSPLTFSSAHEPSVPGA